MLVSLTLVFAQRGNVAGLHAVDRVEQRLALAGAATVFEELEKVPQHLAEADPRGVAIGERSFDGRLVERFAFNGKVADEERRRAQKTTHDIEQQLAVWCECVMWREKLLR